MWRMTLGLCLFFDMHTQSMLHYSLYLDHYHVFSLP
jgi:hypothetical protein